MHVINARNVHCALPSAIDLLYRDSVQRESRNGPVLVATCPVTTVYRNPLERVMFWPGRDCNPFFHLMESLWMLAGHNDVEYVTQFVPRMKEFSDDGKTFHAAYGFRWREHFGDDQLEQVIRRLQKDPQDRRSVVAMWDANCDLFGPNAPKGRDLPCNMIIHFQVSHDGKLDMTVFNRSNDIIWGCYGANAVHMSILQEYMAAGIGVPVGMYWQVSNNWHGYLKTLEPLKSLGDQAADGMRAKTRHDYYASESVKPFPLISTSRKEWDLDLALFMEDPGAEGFRDPFFHKVAKPMYMAHKAFKKTTGPERFINAFEILAQMPKDNDWAIAGFEWVDRRATKAGVVSDGGSQHAQH